MKYLTTSIIKQSAVFCFRNFSNLWLKREREREREKLATPWTSNPQGPMNTMGFGISNESEFSPLLFILYLDLFIFWKQICAFFYSKVILPIDMLYISTSVWVLCTPNAGQNLNFQHFSCLEAKKRKKVRKFLQI